ncbi:MAG: CbiQ family ECF transporter T component [Termitinemataceae bacterium]
MIEHFPTSTHTNHLESSSFSKVFQLHPIAPFGATLAFLITVTSFPSDSILQLIPLSIYPLVYCAVAGFSLTAALERLKRVFPFIVTLALLHPFLHREQIAFGPIFISRGWLICFSLVLKSTLTLLAALLVLMTIGTEGIITVMKVLHVPSIFITLFILIFRYIFLLKEEVYRVLRAYELRSSGHTSVSYTEWGSLPGGILLRTYHQGERVQAAMALRGAAPSIKLSSGRLSSDAHRVSKPSMKDILFIGIWILVFLILRFVPVVYLIGNLFYQ